jgi:hypothetical protein
VAVAACICASAQSSQHRVYSNVQYNEEGGDLLGTELDFTTHAGEIDGVLKMYQGGCADPIHFSGSSSHERLHISARSDAYGKIDISGIVQGNRFEGTLRLEKVGSSEKIRLKKIPKPHC